MRYRIEVEGRVIECESAEDAVALLAALKNGGRTRRATQKRQSRERRDQGEIIVPLEPTPAGRAQLKEAVAILMRVERAGSEGIPVAAIAGELEMRDARGLGVYSAMGNRYLEGTDLAFQDAIKRVRGEDGIKRWLPGKKIARVIAQLKEVLER